MKCNQSRPGFELVSPCSFSTTITITPRAPPHHCYRDRVKKFFLFEKTNNVDIKYILRKTESSLKRNKYESFELKKKWIYNLPIVFLFYRFIYSRPSRLELLNTSTPLERQGRTHQWCIPMDPPHMAKQMQDDQLVHTYSSYVRIRDVALKTCQKRWMIGRKGERGSVISVLAARHDDIYIYIYIYVYIFIGFGII